METSELVFGSVVVVVLLGLAVFYGWRQVGTLRSLKAPDDRPEEERRFLRRQAWRRLVGSTLMMIFAGLLLGSVGFNASLRRFVDRNEEALQNDEERVLDPEEREFASTYGIYWIICLLVVLAMLVTAALDVFAIRGFGRRQISQIPSDRRAMIEREVARMRRDRNGHL
jgi:UDP-N-acetylmuramyl pentapeptide phosphotransferase/UDP-N-acetylglucosamine-1-phosphate transferase